MTRLEAVLGTVLLGASLLFCSREDGRPDPPLRPLVPCVPDAGSDDPLTCPKEAEEAGDAGSVAPPDAGA